MRNFYLQSIPETVESGLLPESEGRHAVQVLRLRESDTIRLLNGRGEVAEAEIIKVAGTRRNPRVNCRVLRKRQLSGAWPRISLYVAPPRSKQMDILIESATALGVAAVVPVKCEHSVAEPSSASSLDRWRQRAVVAIKQSGNPFLPELAELQDFKSALSSSSPGFYGEAALGSKAKRLSKEDIPASSCSLWIGPEGGFSESEKHDLQNSGIRPLAVGDWTLRIEIAVPVLLANLIGARTGG